MLNWYKFIWYISIPCVIGSLYLLGLRISEESYMLVLVNIFNICMWVWLHTDATKHWKQLTQDRS